MPPDCQRRLGSEACEDELNAWVHYSVAQIVELHSALEKIREDTGRWNKTLATLRREQEERLPGKKSPKVPTEKNNALEA